MSVVNRLSNLAMGMLGHQTPRAPGRRLILCYHSLRGIRSERGFVGAPRSLPVETFEAQIAWLQTFARFVSLETMMTSAQEGSGWEIAITFDDGYLDNLSLGLPLFERYEIPVTWFVATAYCEDPSLLPWWDLLDLAIEQIRVPLHVSHPVPASFDFAVPGERMRFRKHYRRLFMAPGTDRTALQRALEEAMSVHLTLPANALARPDEVLRASGSPWIELGGHTHSHVNMAACSREQLDAELAHSRTLLMEWTGQAPRAFAYPFGGEQAVSDGAEAAVRAAAFSYAVTTQAAYADGLTNPYRIPRMTVQTAWTLEAFKAWVLSGDVLRWGYRVMGKAKPAQAVVAV